MSGITSPIKAINAAVSSEGGRRQGATFTTFLVEEDIHYRSLTEKHRSRHPIFEETKNPLSGGVHNFLTGCRRPCAALNRDAIETGFEIALAAQANDLVGDLAFIEKQEGGDCANAVFGGQTLLFIDIDLADPDAAFIFVSQFPENGRDHFARSAPFSPEIHEHGNERIKDFGLKILLSEYNNI